MQKAIKKYTAFFLVFLLILGIGASSYTYSIDLPEDIEIKEEPTELENPIEDPEELEEPEDPENQENPEEPEDPENPEDSEDPGESDEPIGPEDPEDPTEPEEPEGPEDLDSPEEPEDPEDPEDPKDPEDAENPEEPEGPGDPDNPEEPEDPNNPENPENPEEPKDSETPSVPGENSFLKYTILYYLDDIEMIKWQIEGEVPIDYPIVEEVPHDNMPEGYIVDEELSTQLPFEISEENNVIEVYYVFGLMLMANNLTYLEYDSDSQVFPLYMRSINDFTKAALAWFYNDELYLAIGSMHNAPLEIVEYEGISFTGSNLIVDRAANEYVPLEINGVPYTIQEYYGSNTKAYWNVVNLGNVPFTSPFSLYVETRLGGGHTIDGQDNIEIDKSFLVYHQYEDELPILDLVQSDQLDSNLSYSVYPEYEKDGIYYNLVRIELSYNGIQQPNKYEFDLVGGLLYGTVPMASGNASAVITFVYEVAADGELTITKYVDGEDLGKEFDIFIYGPKTRCMW